MSETVNVITRPGTFKVLEAPEKGPQISTIGFQETLQQFSRHLTPGVEIGCPCYIPRGRTPPGAYMLWMAAVRGDREFWMNDQSMLHTQVASLAYIMYIYIYTYIDMYNYIHMSPLLANQQACLVCKKTQAPSINVNRSTKNPRFS